MWVAGAQLRLRTVRHVGVSLRDTVSVGRWLRGVGTVVVRLRDVGLVGVLCMCLDVRLRNGVLLAIRCTVRWRHQGLFGMCVVIPLRAHVLLALLLLNLGRLGISAGTRLRAIVALFFFFRLGLAARHGLEVHSCSIENPDPRLAITNIVGVNGSTVRVEPDSHARVVVLLEPRGRLCDLDTETAVTIAISVGQESVLDGEEVTASDTLEPKSGAETLDTEQRCCSEATVSIDAAITHHHNGLRRLLADDVNGFGF